MGREVVLGSPSWVDRLAAELFLLFSDSVFVASLRTAVVRVQELCESRGGRPGLPVLMSLMVSVDVKQH